VAKQPAPIPAASSANRQERIFAVMFLTILGLSVVAIIALFIGGPTKSGDIWTAVALLPVIGIPLSFLLLIALIVMNAVRRGRAAKGAGK
jgi:hypothetical protein